MMNVNWQSINAGKNTIKGKVRRPLI